MVDLAFRVWQNESTFAVLHFTAQCCKVPFCEGAGHAAGEDIPADLLGVASWVLEWPNRYQFLIKVLEDPKGTAEFVTNRCEEEVVQYSERFLFEHYLYYETPDYEPGPQMLQCVHSVHGFDKLTRYRSGQRADLWNVYAAQLSLHMQSSYNVSAQEHAHDHDHMAVMMHSILPCSRFVKSVGFIDTHNVTVSSFSALAMISRMLCISQEVGSRLMR